MIIDKLLKFAGTSDNTTATIDLKKEGHLDQEYWLVVKAIKEITTANAGTWSLLTSDDDTFATYETLVNGNIGNGVTKVNKDEYVARVKVPFKPLRYLRLSVAASGASPASITFADVEGYLVSGINLGFEVKNMQAA